MVEIQSDPSEAGNAARACYNPARACIEMHLISRRHQTVTVAGRRFEFQHGETIHTEDSHKYTVESFSALAAAANWRPQCQWTDPNRWFSVHFLAAE